MSEADAFRVRLDVARLVFEAELNRWIRATLTPPQKPADADQATAPPADA